MRCYRLPASAGSCPRASTPSTIFFSSTSCSIWTSVRVPPSRFAPMTLADFLARLTSPDGESYYYDDTAEPAEERAPTKSRSTC